MTDATGTSGGANYASMYIPTFREKFWRSLGFRFHLGDEPPDADSLEGWSKTVTHFRFNVLDRLRLLLTGRLKVEVTQAFDAPSPSTIKNRVDYRIIEPGGSWL
jgi:hypothetical protein